MENQFSLLSWVYGIHFSLDGIRGLTFACARLTAVHCCYSPVLYTVNHMNIFHGRDFNMLSMSMEV